MPTLFPAKSEAVAAASWELPPESVRELRKGALRPEDAEQHEDQWEPDQQPRQQTGKNVPGGQAEHDQEDEHQRDAEYHDVLACGGGDEPTFVATPQCRVPRAVLAGTRARRGTAA